MGTGERNANVTQRWTIQWGVEILLLSLHATETGIGSGLMMHLARIKTYLPTLNDRADRIPDSLLSLGKEAGFISVKQANNKFFAF